MKRTERVVRYAVRRRLCWYCFAPLKQRETTYEFECPKRMERWGADVLFRYEDRYGRVAA